MPEPVLATIVSPERPLGLLSLLTTAIRNPIETWPRAVFEEPLVRVGRPSREFVFVTDPELIREMLVEKADAFFKSDPTMRALEPALGRALLTADGPHWRWQRRASAPIFRHERILAFVPAMSAAAERRRAAWLAASGQETDVARDMMRTTFEIIAATMLSGGRALDAERIERDVTTFIERTGWPIALALLSAPRWLPYPGRTRAMRSRDYLRAEITRLVAERREGERREDLVSLLLEALDPETGRAMTDKEITDNLITFILAGHETTALALTFAFYLLAQFPEVEAKVLGEIAAVVGDGSVEAEHIEALAYTRQVVQEAMRLYPPASIVARDAAVDVSLGGHAFAAGTSVNVPIFALHRQERLWPSPGTFDPERFASAAVKARHRYSYMPFGAGPRICIGMSFAMVEAVVILATLLRDVRLTLRPGHVPRLVMKVTLRPANGMPMRLERR
jgi:cytochrome P450